jgi:hypothetical protein
MFEKNSQWHKERERERERERDGKGYRVGGKSSKQTLTHLHLGYQPCHLYFVCDTYVELIVHYFSSIICSIHRFIKYMYIYDCSALPYLSTSLSITVINFIIHFSRGINIYIYLKLYIYALHVHEQFLFR